MLLKQDYYAVFEVMESIVTKSQNIHVHIYRICGRGKYFSKLNKLIK